MEILLAGLGLFFENKLAKKQTVPLSQKQNKKLLLVAAFSVVCLLHFTAYKENNLQKECMNDYKCKTRYELFNVVEQSEVAPSILLSIPFYVKWVFVINIISFNEDLVSFTRKALGLLGLLGASEFYTKLNQVQFLNTQLLTTYEQFELLKSLYLVVFLHLWTSNSIQVHEKTKLREEHWEKLLEIEDFKTLVQEFKAQGLSKEDLEDYVAWQVASQSTQKPKSLVTRIVLFILVMQVIKYFF